MRGLAKILLLPFTPWDQFDTDHPVDKMLDITLDMVADQGVVEKDHKDRLDAVSDDLDMLLEELGDLVQNFFDKLADVTVSISHVIEWDK